jgi:hypothetical protein
MHNPLAKGCQADEWLEYYIDVQIELDILNKSWEEEYYIDNIARCKQMHNALGRYIDASKRLIKYISKHDECIEFIQFNSWAFYDKYNLDKETMTKLKEERKADLIITRKNKESEV